jgi:hypothetical protein
MHQSILLLHRRICWLFYNDTTKMLGPDIKTVDDYTQLRSQW